MKPKLSQIDQAIICGCVADLQRLQQTSIPTGRGNGALKVAVADALNGFVHLDAGKWTGGPTHDASFRVATSRACMRLEKLGLVERLALAWGQQRVTHLAPTAAGLALAKQLAEQPGAGDG